MAGRILAVAASTVLPIFFIHPASLHNDNPWHPSNRREPAPWKRGRTYKTSSSTMSKRSRLSVKGSVSKAASARYTPEYPCFRWALWRQVKSCKHGQQWRELFGFLHYTYL